MVMLVMFIHRWRVSFLRQKILKKSSFPKYRDEEPSIEFWPYKLY